MFGKSFGKSFGKALILATGLALLGGPARADDWVNGIKPGARYSYYHATQSDLGAYHGAALECVLVDWATPGDDFAAGFGRVYFTVDLLQSTRDTGFLQVYTGGFSFSMERNPMRDFLIPFYAIELGGLTHERSGREFVVQPYLGFYLLAGRRFTLDLAAGYLVTTGHFRELHGLRARAGLTVSFW